MNLTRKGICAFAAVFTLYAALAVAGGTKETAKTAPQNPQVRLSTTTSTDQSGLLGHLLPLFEAKTGYQIQIIAVGSGAAIKLGQDGNVDLVLAHAPDLEKAFVASGTGINRKPLMYNDFVLLGPQTDPAGIRAAKTAEEAFASLQKNAAVPFISRGDKSGTHIKEQEIWQALTVVPSGSWYKEIGQGMAQCIIMAGDLGGYTLSDRATWLATKDKTKLTILFSGDGVLQNPYAIIEVNPEKYPSVNSAGAKAFSDWLTSKEGQDAITEYTIEGNQCFFLFD